MEEPESGSLIDVWIGATESTRKKFTAWYDPTRRGYVLESGVFAMDMRVEKMEYHYTTGPAVEGACTIARFDRMNPPYGPQCILAPGHRGDHRFPDEPVEDDNSEILS